MNFVFRVNEQIGEFISSNVRGAWGLLIHGAVVSVILAILGYVVYWLAKLLLTSLVWLTPVIVIVAAVLAVAYLLSKVSGLYR